jgi:malonyl CoA-acyl carrier protein transacylase
VLETTPTAVLFPGQGSQTQNMRDVVADVRPDLLAAVIDLVGEDPFPLVDTSTRYAQPAIFCASLAGWTQVRDRVDPIALAGHSLGEITALAAAGAIDDHDALRLVVLRGLLMDVAGAASGGGTMLAVLGATPAQAGALASRHGVSLANDNAPGQVVLSGAPDALKAARNDARASGLRAVALDVTGAFHSPQMQRAVIPFREALDAVEVHPPAVPVISCATAEPFGDPRDELAEALVSPVRWRETMLALRAAGIDRYVEHGPGAVLTGLVKRTLAAA